MAISTNENADNYSRLQAASSRVSRCIALEAMFRTAKLVEQGYEVDIPAEKVTQIKQEFATLRTEIETLLDNVNPNE